MLNVYLRAQLTDVSVKAESCKLGRFRNLVDEVEELHHRVSKGTSTTKDYNKVRTNLNKLSKQGIYAERQGMEFRKEHRRGSFYFNELIEQLAMWEEKTYESFRKDNPTSPSIEMLMRIPACKKALKHMSLINIAQIIYVEEHVKSSIERLIPAHPKDEYPKARVMRREFIIHYGYTNTGKTYHALQRLKQADKGVYLSPLRLLALEVQETLNMSDVPCSLLTGEEEDILENANHMSSTVEKLDINQYYDVCVIDECQMIGDSQRGFAWTRAILGVRSPEIHLCCAPEALGLLKKIISECGETYTLTEHVRNTELVYVNEPFDIRSNVEPGDALVAFSKKKVLGIASELYAMGIKASVIYGALPYNTRKKQLERFLSGETTAVVATDAIGMGLNLPIRRVIFMEDEKYDGTEVRRLRQNEVKQIAGRAGRMGIYDTGYVLSQEGAEGIDTLLYELNDNLSKAYLGFSEILLTIDTDILDVLKIWYSMRTSSLYTKTDITRALFLINELRIRGMDFPKGDLLRLTNIPFSEDNQEVFALWLHYCSNYKKNMGIPLPLLRDESLYGLEDYYKCIDLYYSFSKAIGAPYSLELIRKRKQETADKINEILISQILSQGKVCSSCGRNLEWDYPYGICEKCFVRIRLRRGSNTDK